MNIRVFRALGSGIPVLESGRLRLWIIPGWRPRLYAYRSYNCAFFACGYWAGMYFLNQLDALEKLAAAAQRRDGEDAANG